MIELLLEPFSYGYMVNAIWVSALVGGTLVYQQWEQRTRRDRAQNAIDEASELATDAHKLDIAKGIVARLDPEVDPATARGGHLLEKFLVD